MVLFFTGFSPWPFQTRVSWLNTVNIWEKISFLLLYFRRKKVLSFGNIFIIIKSTLFNEIFKESVSFTLYEKHEYSHELDILLLTHVHEHIDFEMTCVSE